MTSSITEFSGIVVSNEEWQEYMMETMNGQRIRVRFAGDRRDRQLWRDTSGTLVCQNMGGGPILSVYPYSYIVESPNTEAVSESAVFMSRLIASGMPVELALHLTNRVYQTRGHDQPVPDAIVDRFIAQWRNGGFV
jgi:hypothetical protein